MNFRKIIVQTQNAFRDCFPITNIEINFAFATSYDLEERNNSVSYLLKTKWLMKRHLVKGGN